MNEGPGTAPSGSRRSALVVIAGLILVVLAAIAVPLALSGQAPSVGPSTGPGPGASSADAEPTHVVLPSVSPTLTAATSLPSGPTAKATQPGQTGEPGIPAERIVIARLGIDLPVVEGDGIDAPLGKAAHYPGTAWPGGGSNIYLYGHARDNSFIGLWEARVGDEIVLQLVDGSRRVYSVSEVRRNVAWNDMSVVAPTPTEQLSLQTCNSYQETAPRFLVIAVPKA